MRVWSAVVVMLLVYTALNGVLAEEASNKVASRWSAQELRQLLTGTWGWDEAQCAEGPYHVSFSDDGAIMYFDTDDETMITAEGGEARKRIVYQILWEADGVLRAVIEGEDRRTESGHVVGWDLRMIDEAHFCWHRWDWPRDACTQALIVCPQ